MGQIKAALDKFGTVRKAAEAIGRPPSVIQYWKNVERIPATAQADVLRAAAELGLGISALDLIADSTTHQADAA